MTLRDCASQKPRCFGRTTSHGSRCRAASGIAGCVIVWSSKSRASVSIRTWILLILLVATWGPGTQNAAADSVASGARRHIEDLVPTATIHVAKTADWVAITEDAVWVGSTGPNAVSQIDPRTNTLVATVHVPGEP